MQLCDMNKNTSYVIGVDYGSDSVRSIIVDAGKRRRSCCFRFLLSKMERTLYCDATANQFRQHPLDYVEGLEATIKKCLLQAGPTVAVNVKAISVDTTGSTPVLVNKAGTPLALSPGFENNPNAMFVLWKDHTAGK
jgi:L-ribulokinase